MKFLTKKQVEAMKKRFWIYIAIAVVALLVLAIAPRGQLSQNTMDTRVVSIMPSGLFEPSEDGSSYGYKDKCGKDFECRTCKANLTCLSCMNKCYNRYGPFYKKDNPRLAGAMLCNSKCIDVAEKKSVDADLRFANPDGKKSGK